MRDDTVLVVPMILLGLGYMLPTLIAYAREIPQRHTIAIVNVFFGWTLIGWIITSIWAMNAELPRAELSSGRSRKA